MKRRGSAAKPLRILETVTVHYSSDLWTIFRGLRREAAKILDALGPWKSLGLVHGSVARGDVDRKSDIDILIPSPVSTQLLETRLESAGFKILSRAIVQATPVHAPKAHLFLDPEERKAVTVPLTPFRNLELEFYRFGGAVSLNGILDEIRTVGCTKRLTLIEPTPEGHVESQVLGREAEVARLLRVSRDIVRERVRVLTRRDQIGRTGVFLKIPVADGVSFEEVLHYETRDNPALRRTLRERELHR